MKTSGSKGGHKRIVHFGINAELNICPVRAFALLLLGGLVWLARRLRAAQLAHQPPPLIQRTNLFLFPSVTSSGPSTSSSTDLTTTTTSPQHPQQPQQTINNNPEDNNHKYPPPSSSIVLRRRSSTTTSSSTSPKQGDPESGCGDTAVAKRRSVLVECATQTSFDGDNPPSSEDYPIRLIRYNSEQVLYNEAEQNPLINKRNSLYDYVPDKSSPVNIYKHLITNPAKLEQSTIDYQQHQQNQNFNPPENRRQYSVESQEYSDPQVQYSTQQLDQQVEYRIPFTEYSSTHQHYSSDTESYQQQLSPTNQHQNQEPDTEEFVEYTEPVKAQEFYPKVVYRTPTPDSYSNGNFFQFPDVDPNNNNLESVISTQPNTLHQTFDYYSSQLPAPFSEDDTGDNSDDEDSDTLENHSPKFAKIFVSESDQDVRSESLDFEHDNDSEFEYQSGNHLMAAVNMAPPPPPPPMPGTVGAVSMPNWRDHPYPVRESAPSQEQMQKQQYAHLPDKLMGSMNKDKKPFTYTPQGVSGEKGVLDMSEIRSPRMKQRLMENLKSAEDYEYTTTDEESSRPGSSCSKPIQQAPTKNIYQQPFNPCVLPPINPSELNPSKLRPTSPNPPAAPKKEVRFAPSPILCSDDDGELASLLEKRRLDVEARSKICTNQPDEVEANVSFLHPGPVTQSLVPQNHVSNQNSVPRSQSPFQNQPNQNQSNQNQQIQNQQIQNQSIQNQPYPTQPYQNQQYQYQPATPPHQQISNIPVYSHQYQRVQAPTFSPESQNFQNFQLPPPPPTVPQQQNQQYQQQQSQPQPQPESYSEYEVDQLVANASAAVQSARKLFGTRSPTPTQQQYDSNNNPVSQTMNSCVHASSPSPVPQLFLHQASPEQEPEEEEYEEPLPPPPPPVAQPSSPPVQQNQSQYPQQSYQQQPTQSQSQPNVSESHHHQEQEEFVETATNVNIYKRLPEELVAESRERSKEEVEEAMRSRINQIENEISELRLQEQLQHHQREQEQELQAQLQERERVREQEQQQQKQAPLLTQQPTSPQTESEENYESYSRSTGPSAYSNQIPSAASAGYSFPAAQPVPQQQQQPQPQQQPAPSMQAYQQQARPGSGFTRQQSDILQSVLDGLQDEIDKFEEMSRETTTRGSTQQSNYAPINSSQSRNSDYNYDSGYGGHTPSRAVPAPMKPARSAQLYGAPDGRISCPPEYQNTYVVEHHHHDHDGHCNHDHGFRSISPSVDILQKTQSIQNSNYNQRARPFYRAGTDEPSYGSPQQSAFQPLPQRASIQADFHQPPTLASVPVQPESSAPVAPKLPVVGKRAPPLSCPISYNSMFNQSLDEETGEPKERIVPVQQQIKNREYYANRERERTKKFTRSFVNQCSKTLPRDNYVSVEEREALSGPKSYDNSESGRAFIPELGMYSQLPPGGGFGGGSGYDSSNEPTSPNSGKMFYGSLPRKAKLCRGQLSPNSPPPQPMMPQQSRAKSYIDAEDGRRFISNSAMFSQLPPGELPRQPEQQRNQRPKSMGPTSTGRPYIDTEDGRSFLNRGEMYSQLPPGAQVQQQQQSRPQPPPQIQRPQSTQPTNGRPYIDNEEGRPFLNSIAMYSQLPPGAQVQRPASTQPIGNRPYIDNADARSFIPNSGMFSQLPPGGHRPVQAPMYYQSGPNQAPQPVSQNSNSVVDREDGRTFLNRSNMYSQLPPEAPPITTNGYSSPSVHYDPFEQMKRQSSVPPSSNRTMWTPPSTPPPPPVVNSPAYQQQQPKLSQQQIRRLPPSERPPERTPSKYTGSNIPSRSFRLLQLITGEDIENQYAPSPAEVREKTAPLPARPASSQASYGRPANPPPPVPIHANQPFYQPQSPQIQQIQPTYQQQPIATLSSGEYGTDF